MKTLLKTAAGISFLSFLVGGGCILGGVASLPASEFFPLTALGFVFVGTAFFVGPILLIAAERCGRKDRNP
jgi:hypothetical protein